MYRSRTRVFLTAFTVALVLPAAFGAGTAHAQSYTLGGDARAFAMGGAGIALTQPRGTGGRANPASLAFERNEVVPTFPSVGVRSAGPAKTDAASTYLLGGAKGKDALSIAAQYGSAKSDLGVSGYGALRFGKFEVSASAVGIAHVLPNENWAKWVNNGGKATTLDELGDARADIYAAGYYTLPAVAFAGTLPNRHAGKNGSTQTMAFGLRVKEMRGVYSHRIADTTSLPQTNGDEGNTQLAPEMHGQNTLTKTGIGADLGFLMRPAHGAGFSAAVVVSNFIKPSFVFPVEDSAGKKLGQFDIVQSTVTAGMGYETKTGLTLAADLVNIGGKKATSGSLIDGMNNSGQQFRLGAEQRLFKTLSLRGGYSAVSGATYGVGFFGLDVAFGKKVPLEVIKTLNF